MFGKYGIGKSTLSRLILNQKEFKGSVDKSGNAHKLKSVYRPPHYEIEKKPSIIGSLWKIKQFSFHPRANIGIAGTLEATWL